MSYYRKITAFLMSLAVCATVSAPVFVSRADEETYIYEEDIEKETESTTENEYIVSGEYSYSVLDDGTVCIQECTSQEKEITIPDTLDGYKVSELGRNIFGENSAETIVIPPSVEYISAENPFVQCSSLKEIKINGDSEYYCSADGVLFTKDMKKLVCYPQAKEETEFNIPESTEEIGIAAFYGTKLTDIKIPDSVKKIGRHSFASSSIKSIDLSNTSIDVIDVMAFMNCSSLSEIKFPDNLYGIALSAFYGCKSLENVQLPESLVEIDQNAFMGTGMKKVIIPSSVMSIGYSAFGYDENENAISDFRIIGESGSAAQAYAKDADSEYDYANNFEFTTIEANEAYEEYLKLDTKTFGDYEYITENGEVTIIFCYASDNTANVPEEIEGMKVTAINKNAFLTCTSAEIIIPDTVKTIGEDAFSSYAVKIVISGNCTSIGGDEPFLLCANLQAVDISNVTDILNFAFEGCTSLKSVKLSKELKVVGNDAFYGCPNLKSVRLYDKLETIGDYAFGYEYDDAAAEEAANASEEELSSIMNGQTEAPKLDKLVDDFKIYADEGTLGYDYAKACEIETVTGTAQIGGKNVDKGFIYAVSGIAGGILLAVIGIVTASRIRKGGKKK